MIKKVPVRKTSQIIVDLTEEAKDEVEVVVVPGVAGSEDEKKHDAGVFLFGDSLCSGNTGEPEKKKARKKDFMPLKSFVKNELDSENAIFSCRLGSEFAAYWCVENSDLSSHCDVGAVMDILLEFQERSYSSHTIRPIDPWWLYCCIQTTFCGIINHPYVIQALRNTEVIS